VEKVVEDCAICMESFKDNDGKLVAELNCNEKHIFHADCIAEWVEKKNECPLCRQPIQ
jgi:peroxin-10